MATALSGQIAMSIAMALANPIAIGSGNYPVNYNPSFVFTDGTGANQAKFIFSDTRTLGVSATENLDFNGVLTDIYGNSITMTKLRALIIVAAVANVNDVVVGGAATNQLSSLFGAATERVNVKPGGLVAFVAPDVNGYAVVAATGDLLKILNGGAGTSVTYTIIAVGS